ncbi:MULTISPECIES: hypothetical protein [Streptomyces]|uniref:hypothetical protein n=1 Tax=Streptomyces TaxID=1883 RepID=UPI001371B011|nr:MULTISPECIES: hypothetical protein [unclassified Streptomyces]MYT18327.1 hypothetical protein [Streptomyces sp. SID4951]
MQLVIFGAGFGIIQELREGVVERQRVTPAHWASLIMGRTLSNVVSWPSRSALIRRGAVSPRRRTRQV